MVTTNSWLESRPVWHINHSPINSLSQLLLFRLQWRCQRGTLVIFQSFSDVPIAFSTARNISICEMLNEWTYTTLFLYYLSGETGNAGILATAWLTGGRVVVLSSVVLSL